MPWYPRCVYGSVLGKTEEDIRRLLGEPSSIEIGEDGTTWKYEKWFSGDFLHPFFSTNGIVKACNIRREQLF